MINVIKGKGPPSFPCTLETKDLYLDLKNTDLWVCTDTNTWSKALDNTYNTSDCNIILMCIGGILFGLIIGMWLKRLIKHE